MTENKSTKEIKCCGTCGYAFMRSEWDRITNGNAGTLLYCDYDDRVRYKRPEEKACNHYWGREKRGQR